jgi:CubicO group peptidase (beta-lactamase class C family)
MKALVWTAISAALLLTPAQAQERDASSLEGYWASELATVASVVPMTITRSGEAWRADIGDAEARFEGNGNALRFRFPDNRGGFRGRLGQGGRVVEGFWLQPGRAHDRSRALATPVILRRIARNVWRGEAHPLADTWSVYLRIYRDPEAGLVGAFRNTERNDIGGASRFHVSRDGEAVLFSVSYDGGELRREAELIRPDRLRVNLTGEPVELVRTSAGAIPNAFPWGPTPAPYAYRQPDEMSDGWRTARGDDVGVDETALARAVQRIIDGDPFARQPSLIHSVLVARRGRLVLEEYFFGHDRDTVHDVRSAGKTYASALLGAAMRQGYEIGPQSRVTSVMAARGPFAHADSRKGQITLAHLLTHTSGLDCDDNNDNSSAHEDIVSSQTDQSDWWKFTLDVPMVHDPGARYAYCSAGINLVGGALTDATRTWLPEFFDRSIARPLQMGRYYWMVTPNGDGYLGGGAFMRPRDLLKLGQVYLDGGVWRGRRIVDAAWVEQSTQPRVEITPGTTGLDEETFSNFYGGGADGYAWHSWRVNAGGRVFQGYAASGNGGQLLVVLPELEMTFVFTGGNYRQGGIWTRWPQEIIADEVIAGMLAPTAPMSN